MKWVLLSVVIATSCESIASSPIVAYPVLVAAGVDDGVAPLADVYQFRLSHSRLDEPEFVRSVEIELTPEMLGVSGFFIDRGGFAERSDLDWNGVLRSFRGSPITDSFLRLNSVGVLEFEVSQVSFSERRIAASYSAVAGNLGAIYPSRNHDFNDLFGFLQLSVPAGQFPYGPRYADIGVVTFVDGRTERICVNCLPEPTASLFVGVCLTLFLGRSRTTGRISGAPYSHYA